MYLFHSESRKRSWWRKVGWDVNDTKEDALVGDQSSKVLCGLRGVGRRLELGQVHVRMRDGCLQVRVVPASCGPEEGVSSLVSGEKGGGARCAECGAFGIGCEDCSTTGSHKTYVRWWLCD